MVDIPGGDIFSKGVCNVLLVVEGMGDEALPAERSEPDFDSIQA
jgi:hypothetical protein